MKKHLFTIKEIALHIDDGTLKNDSWDGATGAQISKELKLLGWTPALSLSKCHVASFEDHLKKEGKKVEILVSNCMGVFTQVTVTGS